MRRWAWALVAGTATLHALVAWVFWWHELSEPPESRVFRLLWASRLDPLVFYPMFLVVTLGPVLSLAAWAVKGRHRWALGVTWALSLAVCLGVYPAQTRGMLRVLWWRYVE